MLAKIFLKKNTSGIFFNVYKKIFLQNKDKTWFPKNKTRWGNELAQWLEHSLGEQEVSSA